jgi:hypothetical protein
MLPCIKQYVNGLILIALKLAATPRVSAMKSGENFMKQIMLGMRLK